MTFSDVWDLYGALSAGDPSALSEGQRGLVAICDLRQEVNSGGFDSYFRAWGGNSAPIALQALPGTLGQPWADLLGEALGSFGAEYPADPDERSDALDAANDDDVLAALDNRYYELEGSIDADAQLNAYLASNPDLQP